MEIRHLVYFQTLAEELHFGRAAEKLFISQPPLSRQIKALEKELGVLLFERNNKTVRLTEAGKYFLEESRNILLELDKAKIKARQVQNSLSGDFRLGYTSSAPKKILADVVKSIGRKFPFLHIFLYETSSQRQLTALENGKLDLGIVRTPVISQHLETVKLIRESFCIITAKDKAKTYAKSMHTLPFISFNREYAPDYHQQMLACCRQLGFEPQVIHECNNIASILELVANDIGITILPQSVPSLFPSLKLDYLLPEKITNTTESVLAYDKAGKNTALPLFIDEFRARYAEFGKELRKRGTC